MSHLDHFISDFFDVNFFSSTTSGKFFYVKCGLKVRTSLYRRGNVNRGMTVLINGLIDREISR